MISDSQVSSLEESLLKYKKRKEKHKIIKKVCLFLVSFTLQKSWRNIRKGHTVN